MSDVHSCPDPNCWHRRVTESVGNLTAAPPEKIADWQQRAVAWFQGQDDLTDHGERAAYLLAINGVPALLAALAEVQRELRAAMDLLSAAWADRDAARADAERMRPVRDALRGWYRVAPTTSAADSALMAAWEEHCQATGECYTCDRPRCPECDLCPLCAGDGHDEACSREGDEYAAATQEGTDGD